MGAQRNQFEKHVCRPTINPSTSRLFYFTTTLLSIDGLLGVTLCVIEKRNQSWLGRLRIVSLYLELVQQRPEVGSCQFALVSFLQLLPVLKRLNLWLSHGVYQPGLCYDMMAHTLASCKRLYLVMPVLRSLFSFALNRKSRPADPPNTTPPSFHG